MTIITIDKSLLEQAVEELLPVSYNSTDDPRGQADKVIALLRAALAVPPSAPAWHDAPTEPGLWVFLREDRHKSYRVADPLVWVTAHEIGDRWFGPLPEDTK